ncbi:MAG: serine--tRNA ligase [Firmicutes bacterium]|nr:serine--tRNA ligase [Bacillota bacterium]
MIDINQLKNNEQFRARLLERAPDLDVTKVLELDDNLRKERQKNENLRSERNVGTAKIAELMKTDKIRASKLVLDMKVVGAKIELGDRKIAKLENQIFDMLAKFPNVPSSGVVMGYKEANKVVGSFGKKPEFTFKPKDHVELCTSLGLIDYERGTRMSGSGHWVYIGSGAMLEWALLNYFVDFHTKNGYKFVMPPHLLNYESGYAAGQFPRFMDDVFFVQRGQGTKFDPKAAKFLAPTSETALINMHRGETIPGDQMPIKYFGYSPCYRGEPGGYGASERGTIRGHQFNKVEMFIFCNPDESTMFFDELVKNAEELISGLGLHFNTVALAAGDMSAAMSKTCDTEVWIPSLGYKEVSSISNAICYQARRANVRTKIAQHECSDGVCRKVVKTDYAHTLNASGLATSRLIPAIVEQFQNEDGSVDIPPVLHKYMHGITKLTPQ